MEFLANLIYILHTLLIVFYILAPFSNKPGLLTLHITLSLSLLTHWYYNNSACCLSIIESKLRGIPYESTFIHRLVSPVYEISENSLNTIIYIIAILLMSVSLYKLIRSIMLVDKWTIHTFFGVNNN